MTLQRFIIENIDAIVVEWEGFARTLLPASEGLSTGALRDHARLLLLHIAADMDSPQTRAQRHAKSRGELPENSEDVTETARQHADERFAQRFTLDQMVAEYRALRASVVRLWTEQLGEFDRATVAELVRFGEAMDQALTESVEWYMAKDLESRSLLLGVLGHDLRNPLGAIHNSAHFLLRAGGLDAAGNKATQRIVDSARSMRQMISDLLDFTATQLGSALPVRSAAADMGDICHRAIDELRAFHPDGVLQLECAGELQGHWDAPRMGQLVSNLVGNAIHHGSLGTPVTIKAFGDADAVTLQVHNHGIQIEPDAQQRLFDPLVRQVVRAPRNSPGSSGLRLGLYIARQITAAHGGSISVESAALSGSTFTVRLPRRPPESLRSEHETVPSH